MHKNGPYLTLARWLLDSSEGICAAPRVLLVQRWLAVKEGRKNWEEEISSENNVVMGGTRQDGEL